MDIVGPLLAAGAGAAIDANLKRRRQEFMNSQTSTGNCSSLTSGQVEAALGAMSTAGDTNSGKRGPSATYRLHAAKYLKMDAMLKQLMFPLQRWQGFFGFTQTSGMSLNTADPATATTLAKMAPRSSFRSISFFKLRHTCPRYLPAYPDGSPDNQAKLLNGVRNNIGTSNWNDASEQETVYSYFRRFSNRPGLALNTATPPGNVNGAGGAPSSNINGPTGAPSATQDAGVYSMSPNPGNYKQLWMDWNCSDMESQALAAASFVPNPTATSAQGGNNIDYNQWVNNQVGPQPYSASATATSLLIPAAWKDATMRIADGKLILDVQNGTRTPTVCELVVHSMKKNDNVGDPSKSDLNYNTTDIYQTIWRANNVQNSTKTLYDNISLTGAADVEPAARQGGWNSFWDPKTPFLKVDHKGKKMLEKVAREVHRSIHILAPGESKQITLNLGSLYYTLGGRSGMYDRTDNTKPNIDCSVDGAGTLAVALGAFGVDALQAIGGNSTTVVYKATGAQPNGLEGTGFWIGKTPAPSSLVVAGRYEEAWYPAYFNKTGTLIADSASALPSTIGKNSRTMPLGTIAPVQVSTMEGDSYFDPLGGGRAPDTTQNP